MSNHFYVQQGWIDQSYLASSHLKTPDPRQDNPPLGEELLVSWAFSKKQLEEKLTLELTVRFWDEKEEKIIYPINQRWGYQSFFFPCRTPYTQDRILTYKIRALSEKGEVVGLWEHQLWTELIKVGSL